MKSVAFSLTITLCLALAASGLAFVVGRLAAHAEYEPGSDGYRAIFDRGEKRGIEAGRKLGRRDAARRAEAAGRERAFGEFTAGWSIGSWYLVNIRPGEGGSGYAIGARVEVKRDRWYGMCRQVHVCSKSR
jgi:hypothetical protein